MIHTQGAKRSVLPRRLPSPSECHPQVIRPLQEDSKDHARHRSEYAHNFPQNPTKLSKFDLELRMLRERDPEKVKRSENKVCILFRHNPIPPDFFACFPPVRFLPVFRPCRLTCNPVLWFPPPGPPRFTLSAEKATFALSRRDHGDG